MVTVNIHEIGMDLPSLVDKALAGEEVILAKGGKPVARLVPYAPPSKRRIPGRYAGQIQIPNDFNQTPEDLIDDLEKGDLG